MDQQVHEDSLQKQGTARSKTQLMFIMLGAAALLGAVAYGVVSYQGTSENAKNAALVNGVPITIEELAERVAQNRTLYESQGTFEYTAENLSILEQEALEVLINEALFVQYAQANELRVSDEDTEAQYNEIRARFESEEEFQEQLSLQMFTTEGLKRTIASQLLIEAAVRNYAQAGELEVSEEEAQALYAEYSSQLEMIPPYELVQEDLYYELAQEKLRHIAQRMLSELRDAGEVRILL
ncbi:MAG: SurA N-terminal domain-containing protein [Candidatus Yanofskybacteria bacterium]|nr:SurA N-terminal domain-containing protein [Candidatus Yanofskybacteria bacterium]